jgi:hypothetical protein
MKDAPGDLPAIVLTGLSDASLMGTAPALDCDAFLKKDAGADAIRDKIARVISSPRHMKTTDSYGAVLIPSVDRPPQQATPVEQAKPQSESSIEIPIYELQAGAVLDQGLMSEEGYLMYAAETALREADVARLQGLSEVIGPQTIVIRQ